MFRNWYNKKIVVRGNLGNFLRLWGLAPGDVAPALLPGPLRDGLRSGAIAGLWLPGPQLGTWSRDVLPNLPFDKVTGRLNLAADSRPDGTVQRPAGTPRVWQEVGVDALRLGLLTKVAPAPGARELLGLATDVGALPLLLADDPERPRAAVLLAEATWKWALHPDPRVRGQYRTFWTTLLSWLLAETEMRYELNLDFAPDPGDPNRTLVRVTPWSAEALPRLQRARVQFGALGQRPEDAALVPVGEALEYRFVQPPARPAVIWFQATAELAGRPLTSARRPLLLEVESAEWLAVNPQPERLRRLARTPAQFAEFPEHERVLGALLAGLARHPVHPEVRLRRPVLELLLAGIVCLLIGIEWLLERRWNQRVGAT